MRVFLNIYFVFFSNDYLFTVINNKINYFVHIIIAEFDE